jgi:RNA-directed DNA polymerase
MASGSYFPAPVRRVEIPKGDGKTRPLGIATIADRVAQTVVKRYLEPLVEPTFHEDSYGYRPGRSAHRALAVARQRCWRYDWALDLDIQGFSDNLDWTLLMRAVRRHTGCPWVLLYLERWLKAPVQMPDGTLSYPTKGSPQGAVVSPVLSNLFLHYAFDHWMQRHHTEVPFERYADDIVCHCRTEAEANALRDALETRLRECGLKLHPLKTKVVYCKDSNRPGQYPVQSFDFLGHTFRPRRSKNRKGELFVSFSPAISAKAVNGLHRRIRRWRLHRRNDLALEDLALWTRPVLLGGVRYYGRFHAAALRAALRTLDAFLGRWAQRKYRYLRGRLQSAWDWFRRIKSRQPDLFAHWPMSAPAGR